MKKLLLILCWPLMMVAEERIWDQEKAMAVAQKMINLEKEKGQPWDQLKWMTDPVKALAKMKSEKKPALVYFYVDKGGPKVAPC